MTPESHRFTAGACRYAAEVYAGSPSEAQRRFAPVLEQWAANAERRAEEAITQDQPDLFGGIAA